MIKGLGFIACGWLAVFLVFTLAGWLATNGRIVLAWLALVAGFALAGIVASREADLYRGDV